VTSSRLGAPWLTLGVLAVVGSGVLSLVVGAADLPADRVLLEILDRVPGVRIDSGLTQIQKNVVWEIRAPRAALSLLVGAMLSMSGAAYQGSFRNPLADPYLLGIGAGAGLGATLTIVNGIGDGAGLFDPVAIGAFLGAGVAVALTFTLARTADSLRSPISLILAGVAIAAFFTALQTYVQQQNVDTIREVYSWILGSLRTSGWSEVLVILPYAIVTGAILMASRRLLDVLAVGDDEAITLGIDPRRVRLVVVLAASAASAAAVAVSGLIGFVGIIVPHGIRLLAGSSYRRVMPLSIMFGAAFLALTDLLSRTITEPAELPIGVVTAIVGAPFFLVVLRTSRRQLV
jgi:iron complex transport system permease protein